ncbi:MAG: 3-oxoacyl-ACP synthase III [Myxococcota bacterium]
MFFDKVSIMSVSHIDAPHRISTDHLEKELAPLGDRLDVDWDMLRTLTGIEARHFWDEGVMPSQVATQAAELAIEEAGISRDKIGILINTSVCRDYIEPSTASIVHGNLGLAPDCMNFDLGNACLAFINGMQVAGNMIERDQVDYALIVDGEGSRGVIESTIQRMLNSDIDITEFRDNYATFTLGSGAAAMVLARADLAPGGHRYRGGIHIAATEHSGLCRGQVDNMQTDTKALLMAGLQLAKKGFRIAKEKMGWAPEVLDELVMHQVSKVHTEQLAAMLGLDLNKAHRLYPEHGNVGPASVPIVLSKAAKMGRIKPGNRVALMGIGSGLNVAMSEVIW